MKYQKPDLQLVGTATELIQGAGNKALDGDQITRQVQLVSTELEHE